TGVLIYWALANQIPLPVAEFIQTKIHEEERASTASKDEFDKALAKAGKFQAEVKKGNDYAQRAIELAADGIPVGGADALLDRDPKTQFQGLFMAKCAACHSYADEKDNVVSVDSLKAIKPLFKIRDLEDKKHPEKAFKFTASDLAGFGTQDWIYHFLK